MLYNVEHAQLSRNDKVSSGDEITNELSQADDLPSSQYYSAADASNVYIRSKSR